MCIRDRWYRELLSVTAGVEGMPSASAGAEGLAELLTELVAAAGLHTKLEPCGINPEQMTELASAAAKQWTGTFNPRDVDSQSLLQIYQQAF